MREPKRPTSARRRPRRTLPEAEVAPEEAEARLTRLVVEVAPEVGVAHHRHSWPLPEAAEVAEVRPCRRRSWLPPEEVAVVGHRTRLAVAAVVGA